MENKLTVYVSAKLHRLMRQLQNQFVDLGCFLRASSEENESLYKPFKKAYSNRNSHINLIASQLLQAPIDDSTVTSPTLSPSSVNHFAPSVTQLTQYQVPEWFLLKSKAIDFDSSLSSISTHFQFLRSVLNTFDVNGTTWRKLKFVSTHQSTSSYDKFGYKTVYGADLVYRVKNSMDCVSSNYNGTTKFVFV